MSDERQLLEAACAGDEKAFALLIGPYQAQLRTHCYRMLGLCTTPRMRCKRQCFARGADSAASRVEARFAPGCIGSPPTPACA
jgi:hypothetical protein